MAKSQGLVLRLHVAVSSQQHTASKPQVLNALRKRLCSLPAAVRLRMKGIRQTADLDCLPLASLASGYGRETRLFALHKSGI